MINEEQKKILILLGLILIFILIVIYIKRVNEDLKEINFTDKEKNFFNLK